MNSTIIHLTVLVITAIGNNTFAQDTVKPLAPQSELLKSDNPKYAVNKKLVYDMWLEFLEAGHVELAEKYFTESHIQHNPNIASARTSLVEAFGKRT